MLLPYRCTQCHTVLSRQTPTADELKIQNRRIFTCSNCYNQMPSQLVDSGALDLIENLPPVNQLSGHGPYELSELLAFLRSNHNDQYFYRGQTKCWPGPLVPSLYRKHVTKDEIKVATKLRLRELGNSFHEVFIEQDRDKLDKQYAKRIDFNQHLNQVFGYPSASMLAQQCGITSEGLDISHDPDVAAFFAAYDFQTGQFPTSGEGVIYRIPFSENANANTPVQRLTFYDCPTVLSGFYIFQQLARAKTWDEARASFQRYMNQLALNMIDNTENKRIHYPLELLMLPIQDVKMSRVIQQAAALLFPDTVLPDSYKMNRIQPPQGKAEWKGPLLIEDLSKRPGVETFLFRHNEDNKRIVNRSPNSLFPKDDALTKMLYDFFSVNPLLAVYTERGYGNFPDLDLIE